VDAPRPKRRVWAFVAAAVVPLIGVFVGVMVMKQGGKPDDDGARTTVATSTPPKIAQARPGGATSPDPDVQGVAPITDSEDDADGSGHGTDVGAGSAAATVRVTLTGLPAGTAVLDPDGKVLTTAAGGDTVISLTTGTQEVTIGLHHPTLGDNYVMLTPSENLVKPAPTLIPQTTTSPEVGGKKPTRPRKDPNKDRPKSGDGAGKAPGGDNSNATERPVFKQ
jgi:hypothetical protein